MTFTIKVNLLKDTAMFAKVALADILESSGDSSLRFVQNDNTLTSFASLNMTFQCDSTVKV